MIKKIFFFILLAFVSFGASAQSKAKPKPKPKPKAVTKNVARTTALAFDELKYNFGIIKQGTVIEHQFQFRNTSKRPVNVTSATATCGCTVPSYPFIPVMPGETANIGVTFDTKHKMGVQKPIVTVTTDAGTYKITMEGHITE